MIPATTSPEAVLEGFIGILHEHGADKVPERYRQEVLDAEWERICDPETGFAYFWLWYAMVQIKGRRKKGQAVEKGRYGWQRACPGGLPRTDSSGRSWHWQYLVALEIVLYDLLLMLKARQIGMSFEFANLVDWAAMTANEQNIAVIANKLQSAERLVRRAHAVYRRLPGWMRERCPVKSFAIRRTEFANGSVVEPYSGDPNAARSEAATWVFVDEVGEIEHLYEFYAATESVAEGEGCHFVLFGTAKDNGIEAWCIDGDAGDVVSTQFVPDAGEAGYTIEVREGLNGMHFMFLPYFLHPARDEAWMARKRRTYKGNLANLDREYPGTWQQAFQAVGSKFFDEKARMRAIMSVRDVWEARDRRGTLVMDATAPSGIRFAEDGFGHVVMHASDEEMAAALSDGRPFTIGADCAGDRPMGDFHAATGLHVGIVPESDTIPQEVIPHQQLMTIHGYMDGDHYGTLLCRMGLFLNRALLGIEVNGLGVAVLKRCRALGYPKLYARRTAPTTKKDRPGRELGWYSTSANKSMGYGEAERLLRNEWIDIRDPETLEEMGQVLTLGGGKIGAREPRHDDRPDGLMIAVAMVPYAGRVVSSEVVTAKAADYDPFSMDRAFHRLARKSDKVLIGNEMGDFMAARGY
jgi:hypothetical protein